MGMDYMERFHLIQHPLLEHKLFQLRNKYTGTKDFRKCVEEMTSLLCYEATRDIPMGERPVETPFGEIKAKEIEGKTLAAVVILRAGLGMLDGVLSLVPSAKVGHIGIYKDEKTGELVRYYCKMPQDIVHRQVLLLEPILATGETGASSGTDTCHRGDYGHGGADAGELPLLSGEASVSGGGAAGRGFSAEASSGT